MDREIISALMRDLKEAKSSLDYLRKNPERNFAVSRPGIDYLNPRVREGTPEEPGEIFPLGHKNGAFIYIIRIKNIIEKALAGQLSRDELPANSPSHLEAAVSH